MLAERSRERDAQGEIKRLIESEANKKRSGSQQKKKNKKNTHFVRGFSPQVSAWVSFNFMFNESQTFSPSPPIFCSLVHHVLACRYLFLTHTHTQKVNDRAKDRKAHGTKKREVSADGKEGSREEGGPQSHYHVFLFEDRTGSVNRWSR